MTRPIGLILAPLALVLLLGACLPVRLEPDPTAGVTVSPTDLPPAVEYDLGETTIVQARFPTESRFRTMPVRLNGIIAAPAGDEAPYPVVVILHGNHPGCPIPAGDEVDRWPCDPALEQPNYRGFRYLVRRLAAQGYVALSININAENTFGFGEPTPGERLQQLVDLHLKALATATAGGANGFGVELAGRADLERLTFIGHSRGGEAALALVNDLALSAPAATIGRGYGPARGVLLIAPAIVTFDPTDGARAPMALILPACDGDMIFQEGQTFYEAARLAPEQREWAVSVWLERANHNYFNEVLADEGMGRSGRPDCATLLAADVQRDFLAQYATDFLTTLFEHDPALIRAAMLRLGVDLHTPAPAELYGLPVRLATLAAARDRLTLLTPASSDELVTSRLAEPVTAGGLTTHFCPAGYYTPEMLPDSEPCRRVNVTIPGQPAHVVVSWTEPGATLRFALPTGVQNLHFFTALTLRAAVDPLSPLNAPGAPQAFSVQLTDQAGNQSLRHTRPDEPALQFPPGYEEENPFFGGGLFTGRVPLTTVRLRLSDFEGVNLAAITEIALVFERTPSGSLFMADVELVRAPIAEQETLDAPPSAELIAAAETGDVEAQRQLANLYRPHEALGVRYGNVGKAVFWYRQACAAGYANAQVDFYEFARLYAEMASDRYLPEAIVCLEDAIRQGHRSAILNGAFRAAFIEQDYKTGFFLYALFEESEPELAARRLSFAGQLTQAEIDEAEKMAAEWRANNSIKDYNDFFAEVNSPFRQVATPPPAP